MPINPNIFKKNFKLHTVNSYFKIEHLILRGILYLVKIYYNYYKKMLKMNLKVL